MTGHLFCFGLGYSSACVARRLAQQGWQISGTSTTSDGVSRLNAIGYGGYLFDGHTPNDSLRQTLSKATHVLLSIPPKETGDPAFAVYGDALRAAAQLKWIGYYSTVGVYGDTAGAWVDEETPPEPGSDRGKRRLAAETAWLALAESGRPAINILRLPGIYGPGRSAVDDVRAGTARRIIKPGQVFNRIHVTDIARATIAAMVRGKPQRVYNVTDDDPAPPQDVVEFAAQLLGATLPPALDFATAELSPMARSFYSESKRVSNALMKAELGMSLAYPTYREGLAAIASGECRFETA